MKFSTSLLAVCLVQLVSAAPSLDRRAVSGYNGIANSGVRPSISPTVVRYLLVTSGQL